MSILAGTGQLGVGEMAVQKWARQGRFSDVCVSGPNVDGHHGYIFNKKRLLRWYEDWLKSS